MTILSHTQYIGFLTVVRKEVVRVKRIWMQSILPPLITTSLYFIVFGRLVGARIGDMHGVPFIRYIVPGLVMMSVMQNAYMNVCSSFFGAKFSGSIEEMLVSPIGNTWIVLGYVLGGVFRGGVVGILVTVVALFFTHLPLQHAGVMCLTGIITALLFSLLGLLNGIFAKNFDQVGLIPTFLLTPLIYLGGVFYSIDTLPYFWRCVSLFNPVLYVVNTFRFGVLGITDINVSVALCVMSVFTGVLFCACVLILSRGYRLRD